MTALWRIAMPVDVQALTAFGRDCKLIPAGGDPGYVLHAALTALYGAAAPKPFRLMPPSHGRDRPLLLGYSGEDATGLEAARRMQAMDVPHHDAAAASFDCDSLVVRPMPEAWRVGQRLNFEVRVRPMVRTTRNDVLKAGGGREIDAYLARKIQAADRAAVDRTQTYCDWLAGAFTRSEAAEIDPASLQLKMLTRTRLYTGAKSGALSRAPEGPDALFEGRLTVRDQAKFADLVRRGIGRHRAFGFGMLLLAPAR